MINLTLLRERPQDVIDLIRKKDPEFDIDRLIVLDEKLREINQDVESLRAEKNALAKQAKQGVTSELREKSIQVGKDIKQGEQESQQVAREFKDLYLRCPNLIQDDVPLGNKESNQVVKTWGEKPVMDFEPRNHVELGESLGWLDFEAGARIAKSNFALYKGDGAKLVWALNMFMLQHAIAHDYTPVAPPYLVNEKSLEGASNFPRFKEEVFALEQDGLYLTPTAEVNLANLHRDEILLSDDLPIRMTALTSCFRREAGGYGATERGLIRMHQFDKVELFALTHPDRSDEEQQRMLACAESILQKLGLHYRVSLLAAQDCSFPSSKTYDIEVWMPGQNEYKEVSSISNCTDFQSRRCAIRFKEEAGSKAKLVHTLNGSSLALPRLMVALIETYQQSDGSIVLPDILRSGMFNL